MCTLHVTFYSKMDTMWNVIREHCNTHDIQMNTADVVVIEQLREIRDLNYLYIKALNLDYQEKVIDDTRGYSK